MSVFFQFSTVAISIMKTVSFKDTPSPQGRSEETMGGLTPKHHKIIVSYINFMAFNGGGYRSHASLSYNPLPGALFWGSEGILKEKLISFLKSPHRKP